MEDDIRLKGGKKFIYDSSFMISISRSKCMGNPRIKIIRSKFTPAKDESDGK